MTDDELIERLTRCVQAADGKAAASRIAELLAERERFVKALGWLDHDISALRAAEDAMWQIGRNDEASDIHSKLDALEDLKKHVDSALSNPSGEVLR